MWRVKVFKGPTEQRSWVNANAHRYQIVVVFTNNGYAVRYRKLRVI